MREIGTDEVMSKYSISRHNLNILIEHSPDSIGYLRQDRIWNGQAYINKNIFNADVEVTKEEIEQQVLEVKAKIKADKKANATDEEIILARRRTLEKHNKKHLKEMVRHTRYPEDINYEKKSILEQLDKIENIEYKIDKKNDTATILKSINEIQLKIIVDREEYKYRVNDEIPIYYLDIGDEIEWERIEETTYANVSVYAYKYIFDGEQIGIDYKILDSKLEQKFEVLEKFITYKY